MQADWIQQGGPIMYPLLGCSVVAVTISVERMLFWWRHGRARNEDSVEQVIASMARGDVAEARTLASQSDDMIARAIHAGLAEDHGTFEANLTQAAGYEIRRMRKYLRVLDTIVTVAPLLGILGTVLGIITSFDVIGGGGIDNPVEVTGGIAQALLTTAVGLIVAIIALIPYNYFNSRMEDAVTDLELQLTRVEALHPEEASR